MKKYTKIICMVVAVCLLGAAAFFGFRIYSHYACEIKQEKLFDKIASEPLKSFSLKFSSNLFFVLKGNHYACVVPGKPGNQAKIQR